MMKADAASAFIRQSQIAFDNYLDSKLVLENMLGANAIPLTVLVDANGRVIQKVRGSREWDSQESLDLIRKALRVKM